MNSAVGRLVQAELKLMMRDPLVLTFVVAFPIVTMLIIGGAFGTQPDQAFDFVNPAHWYVASYLTVVIAAMGLVMLPVHLASYRERGVLRRFAAAGFPRWSFPISQLIVGLVTITVSCALLLAGRRAGLRPSPDARVVAGHGRARTGLDRLRQPRRGARLGAPVGAIRPGRRPADLLPVVPARRGRPATARDGLGGAASGWAPAADVADQRGARALARPRVSYRIPGRGSRPGGGRHCPRGPPDGPVTRDSAVRRTAMPGPGRPRGPFAGTGPSASRSIQDMSRDPGTSHPAEFSAGWARWMALGLFAVLVGVAARCR